MSDATLTSKGQVTIPADIRKAMGLQAGERVVFTRLDDGTTVMRAKTRSAMELKGLLKDAAEARKNAGKSTAKVSVADMNIGRD